MKSAILQEFEEHLRNMPSMLLNHQLCKEKITIARESLIEQPSKFEEDTKR